MMTDRKQMINWVLKGEIYIRLISKIYIPLRENQVFRLKIVVISAETNILRKVFFVVIMSARCLSCVKCCTVKRVNCTRIAIQREPNWIYTFFHLFIVLGRNSFIFHIHSTPIEMCALWLRFWTQKIFVLQNLSTTCGSIYV